MLDPEVKRRLDRIDEKLTRLIGGSKKEHWIGPSWLKRLTGWNRDDMRKAREQGLVQYKESRGGGWLYLLESIPDVFIIKNKVA